MIDFKNMSADSMEELAKELLQFAKDLRKEQPSYELALLHGVSDRGYPTVANGYVSKYSGEAIIKMDNGKRWKAIGHGPRGDAYSIFKQGYIEFIPLED